MNTPRTHIVVIAGDEIAKLQRDINNAIQQHEANNQWFFNDIKIAANDGYAIAVIIFREGVIRLAQSND